MPGGHRAGDQGAAVEVVRVPGAWELPQAAARVASLDRHDAIVAIGFNIIYNTTGIINFAQGEFVMLGKTFKGLTDRLLEWQTRRLLELELGREGHVVHVRPELVVEIAVNEIQTSPKYPGGMALRFARVKRYREDKAASEADTIDAVGAIYEGQAGQAPA